MHFTVYSTETGEILRSGDCAPEDHAFQADPEAGEAVLAGDVALDDSAWRVDLATLAPVPHTIVKGRDELVSEIAGERERRFASGFNYDFTDERGTHRIGTTQADMTGWDDVAKLAASYIATGKPKTKLAIETDTGPVTVTAKEWQSIMVALGEFRQSIWSASFALQALDPIPQDITDDTNWPVAG